MRVNRGLLYWGVLLVAIGGVLVAADLGLVPTTALTDILRLWPLAVIAVGLAIVVRRTRYSLPALLVAAAVPGLVVGAAFAAAPRFVDVCADVDGGAPISGSVARQGSFDRPADVSIRTGCGFLRVDTASGNEWRLAGQSGAGRVATVESSPRSLSLDLGLEGLDITDVGRDRWEVTLPTSEIDRLKLVVSLGGAEVALDDASIRRLEVTANAGRSTIDASTAAIDELSGAVNVGSLAIRLPAASDLVGSLEVGGGQALICPPPGLGLRITSDGFAEGVSVAGDHIEGSTWQNPEYATATHRADLRVHTTFGAVEIDPKEGCA
jgi:hypothetical protein